MRRLDSAGSAESPRQRTWSVQKDYEKEVEPKINRQARIIKS